MKVKVYRNLHRKCFSIMDYKTKRVVDHKYFVVLRNAEFKVSEAGRQRVLREKKKNVHAFVVGDRISNDFHWPDSKPIAAYYNPYKTKLFINKKTKAPIRKARMVLLGNEILVWR